MLTALWVTRSTRGQGRGRRVGARSGSASLLGFAGSGARRLAQARRGEVTPRNLALAIVALLGITIGTLYQKRYVAPCDVRTASAVQMLAALVVCAAARLARDRSRSSGTSTWSAAMAWSVGVLTLGGSSLLYLLIQRGEATAVTSLLYLVPPCTALMAWATVRRSLHAADDARHGADGRRRGPRRQAARRR